MKLIVLFVGILLLSPAMGIEAQNLASPNYTVENAIIDSGGQNSSSTNYSGTESLGGEGDALSSSSNYSAFAGFIQHAYPGVPGQPTLANTGGTLYNSLDFVVATGGNPSDAQYALAISSDSFATTYFIQTDNTLATSTAWNTYVAWGGSSGGRVTGLSASTTYQLKIKARFAANTETAYSITAQTATINPNFTMTISGVNSGTAVAGAVSTITTTSNGISFGSLVSDAVSVAMQKVTISTNAAGGYTTTVRQEGSLTNAYGVPISPVSGTNALPASFPASVTTGAFGYHTTDASLCTGSATRFSSNDTYAGLSTSQEEAACSQTPVTAEETYLVYKVLIGAEQASGAYNNVITYVSYGVY